MSEPAAMFELPLPPSANALFTNRAGSRQRIKTDAYRAWIHEAGWRIAIASPGVLLLAPVRIEINLPFDRKRDISNGIKAIEDLLVRHQIIKDDRWVDELTVRRVPADQPLVIMVWKL